MMTLVKEMVIFINFYTYITMDQVVPEVNIQNSDMNSYTYQDLDNITRHINEERNLSEEEERLMQRLQEILNEEHVVPRGRGGKKRKKKTGKHRKKTQKKKSKKRKTRVRRRK